MAVSDGCDEEVDRRQPMVAEPRELPLSVQRALLDVLIDVEVRECEEFVHEPVVVPCIPCRVAGLEEEWQACGDVAGLERGSEFSGAVIWDRRVAKSYPRRVVQ